MALAGISAGAAKELPLASSKTQFDLHGTYLNAAYTHPLCRTAYDAGAAYQTARLHEPAHPWPLQNPRDAAVSRYARLINSDPSEVAVVPNTQTDENLIVAAVGGTSRTLIVPFNISRPWGSSASCANGPASGSLAE
jgi:hypothetical protein